MKKSNRLSRVLALAMAAALTLALAVPAMASEPSDDVQILCIVHTNDVHSRVAGEAYVAGAAQIIAETGAEVLILNAGDTLHGQPFATISRGASIVELLNAVGYSAMVPGNHDFNYGTDHLLELAADMDFPLLAANVLDKATGEPVFEPWVIIELGFANVGIFGLATPETTTKTNPVNVENVIFEDPAAAAERAVAELHENGADIVIALVHLGVDESTVPEHRSTYIAENVDGIDLIVDGHSHTTLENGLLINDTLIVQTGEYLTNVGLVQMGFKNGEVVFVEATLVPAGNDELIEPDASITALIDEINAANEIITSEIIGSITVDLVGEREFVRTSETNLANLVTDSMLNETGADIAITNGGGLRATIAAGDVTIGDILTVLPFGNYIITMDLSGADVLAALENGLKDYPETAGHFPQIAGIIVTFNPDNEPGSRVVSAVLEATGEALDHDTIYTVATNDFMANGGDGYVSFMNGSNLYEFSALDEAVIRYIQDGGEIFEAPKGNVTPVQEPVPVEIPVKIQIIGVKVAG